MRVVQLLLALIAAALVVASTVAPVSDDAFCRKYVIAFEDDILERLQKTNPDAKPAPESWVISQYKGCISFLDSPEAAVSTSRELLGG